MKTHKKRATIAGLLFIIAAVTAIIGLLLYDPVLHNADYIIAESKNGIQIVWGAFFEILLTFSMIGTCITLFPMLKKYNESLALGTVCFRLLECIIIIIGIISLLTIEELREASALNSAPNTNLLVAAQSLLIIHNWTFLFGPNIFLGPSTFLTGYLLYQSRLVPNSIAIMGMIGGPLISLSGILVMFGFFEQLSPWGILTAIPVFVYEMSLAVRLIYKGFNPTIASCDHTKRFHRSI
jgi:hypothetical protein